MDRCVCCGAVIPEGRMVCPICEKYGTNPRGYYKVSRRTLNGRRTYVSV